MYNGMLFNNKKECTETHKTQMSIKAIMVSKKIQQQKKAHIGWSRRRQSF